mmetsp:Transcript_37671/g.70443  ORF Transcript_37671/g.70443 Transcript_37671/m.70443 type:complete len:531 (+) Transcript_37671:58-1650(+)
MPARKEEQAIEVLEALQPQLSEAASHWNISFAAYFVILSVGVVLQLTTIIGLAVWSYVSCKRRMGARCFAKQAISYPLSAIVPCYLPNEADIIKGTIEHLLTKLTYIDHLNVYMVYNTPRDMELEKELHAMAAGPMPTGRRLFVERVYESRSKAANLNHILPRIDTDCVAIYDADHHPQPESLAMAVQFLMRNDLDCCQGSTFIREGGCLLGTLINAEFFVSYFIVLPVLEKISGTAFFGGANGIWRTDSLHKCYFDTEMMTEDIDCFARAYETHGFKFRFLPESRSGELAPASWSALWKQRMRWALGWDQVTIKSSPGLFRSNIPRRRRCALSYIFYIRYLSVFCGTTVTIYNTWSAVDSLTQPSRYVSREPVPIQQMMRITQWLMLVVVVGALMQIWLHEPKLSLVLSVAVYYLLLPIWIAFQCVMVSISLYKITRGNVGSWVVTSRAGSSTSSPEEDMPKWKWGNVAAVLAVSIMLQGLIIGSVFAYGVCQRKAGDMLISWTAFGLLAPTAATALDGKVAVQGLSAS